MVPVFFVEAEKGGEMLRKAFWAASIVVLLIGLCWTVLQTDLTIISQEIARYHGVNLRNGVIILGLSCFSYLFGYLITKKNSL